MRYLLPPLANIRACHREKDSPESANEVVAKQQHLIPVDDHSVDRELNLDLGNCLERSVIGALKDKQTPAVVSERLLVDDEQPIPLFLDQVGTVRQKEIRGCGAIRSLLIVPSTTDSPSAIDASSNTWSRPFRRLAHCRVGRYTAGGQQTSAFK